MLHFDTETWQTIGGVLLAVLTYLLGHKSGKSKGENSSNLKRR